MLFFFFCILFFFLFIGRVTRLIMYSYLLYHVWDSATGISRLGAGGGFVVRGKQFDGVLNL